MADIAPARDLQQRKRDTLDRLEQDVDAWVATADAESGTPHLVPLSFLWDGQALLFATFASSPTGRNLQATRQVRLGIGGTRDVVLIEGTVETLPTESVSPQTGDAFAAKTGFDPRRPNSPFRYYWVTPMRIQAWREENELAGRLIMRDGKWLEE
jgi:hypothetical protein